MIAEGPLLNLPQCFNPRIVRADPFNDHATTVEFLALNSPVVAETSIATHHVMLLQKCFAAHGVQLKSESELIS